MLLGRRICKNVNVKTLKSQEQGNKVQWDFSLVYTTYLFSCVLVFRSVSSPARELQNRNFGVK